MKTAYAQHANYLVDYSSVYRRRLRAVLRGILRRCIYTGASVARNMIPG